MPWLKPGFEGLFKDIARFREIMSDYEPQTFNHAEELKSLTGTLSAECAIYSVDPFALLDVCNLACKGHYFAESNITNASLVLSELYKHCVTDKNPNDK